MTRVLGSLLMLVLVFAGCGGSDGGDGEARSRAPERPPAEPEVKREYALETQRELPADVPRQVEYNEGGDGCAGFENMLVSVSSETGGLDPGAEVEIGLGDDLIFCPVGPATGTVSGPNGVVKRFERSGALEIDLYRGSDLGRYRLDATVGGERVRLRFRVVPARSPIVRALNPLGPQETGKPLRVIGAGFRPGEEAGLRFYGCSDDPSNRMATLKAVVPIPAGDDGTFAYDLLTRRGGGDQCLVVRSHSDREVRDDWFENQVRIVGDPDRTATCGDVVGDDQSYTPWMYNDIKVRGMECADAKVVLAGGSVGPSGFTADDGGVWTCESPDGVRTRCSADYPGDPSFTFRLDPA